MTNTAVQNRTEAERDETGCGVAQKALRAGEACPRCGSGRLDYDGLLNLSCTGCGFSAGGGGFT